MTTDGWGWTKVYYYSVASGSVYWIPPRILNIPDISDLYNSYVRTNDYSKKYAFRFDHFYTKQCWATHGSKKILSVWVQDYISQVLQITPWGTCDRIDTPWDENDIQIKRIIDTNYGVDACITWNMWKTDARNTAWSTLSLWWRNFWWIDYRLSWDSVVLFWSVTPWASTRCANALTWPWTDNISIYVR